MSSVASPLTYSLARVVWLVSVWVALLAPLGCSAGDRSPPLPGPAERVASTKQALTNLDTTPGNTTTSAFGQGQTPTFGQTITVPLADTILNSFSFSMSSVPATVVFRGEVYAWDGTKTTGPNLFESAAMMTAGAVPQTITFATGGITLTAGAQYVLFATASLDPGSGQPPEPPGAAPPPLRCPRSRAGTAD